MCRLAKIQPRHANDVAKLAMRIAVGALGVRIESLNYRRHAHSQELPYGAISTRRTFFRLKLRMGFLLCNRRHRTASNGGIVPWRTATPSPRRKSLPCGRQQKDRHKKPNARRVGKCPLVPGMNQLPKNRAFVKTTDPDDKTLHGTPAGYHYVEGAVERSTRVRTKVRTDSGLDGVTTTPVSSPTLCAPDT